MDLGHELPIDTEEPWIVDLNSGVDLALNQEVNPELVNQLLKNQQDTVFLQVNNATKVAI